MKFSNFALAAVAIAASSAHAFSTPKFAVHQATILKSTAVDADTKTALATAANEARGLAMDSIAAAHSGHMGLPLGPLKLELSYTGHRCPTTPPIRSGSIVIDSSFPQGTVQCFFIHGSTLPDLIFRWKKLRTSVNTTR